MKRITIYRNHGCDRCRRIMGVHRRFDWFGHLDYSDEPPPEVGPLQVGEVAVVDAQTGAILRGVDAVRRVCREVPAYAPFRLLLKIPALARRADRLVRGDESAESCELRPLAESKPARPG